ncbi:ankyrin repeat [Fusarium sporotrichioides]|uniref:Ankyrin repeat n=1 Tax=Fusarium sporotrichioides TaxID=5514 RepID=A0A395SIA4_FUSSP|nr:ankyrin repeat [Fusarium sporotrichioides]
MGTNDEHKVFPSSDIIQDDKPNVKLKANYLVSKDSAKLHDGVETTEQLLALEIRFTSDLPDEWAMHLEIARRDGTLEPKVLGTAQFKINETDKNDQSYYRLSNKPTIDTSLPATMAYEIKPLDKDCLCLAIFFRGSNFPNFKLSFRRKRKLGGFSNTPVSTMDVVPLKSTTDQTPFSWAFTHGWFDVFVRSENENMVSWAALNGGLELMEHLKTHSKARFESLLEHRDKDGRTPLSLSAGVGKEDIVEFLLDAGANIQSTDDRNLTPIALAASLPDSRANYKLLLRLLRFCYNSDKIPTWWVLKHLYQAARFGWLLVITVICIRLDINVDDLLPSEATALESEKVYYGKTALCIAAEYGNSDAVQVILACNADVNSITPNTKNTPLMLAINSKVNEYLKAAVVDALLTGGALISLKNANEETAEDLAIKKGLQSVSTRLTWRSKDGPAAERPEQLVIEVDDLFSATVTTFETEGDTMKRFVPEKYEISELLHNPKVESKEIKEVAFKWIHLPANNMRWTEVLISQLYKDKMQIYNVLKPERWVGRQHHRGLNRSDATPDKPGIHHARFMEPMCQAFRSSRDLPGKDKPLGEEEDDFDTNLVLFMPYLHWDITKQQTEREEVIKQTLYNKTMGEEYSADQRLLNAYLFHKKDSQDQPTRRLEPHYMHQPHVRRTLDQYYYHDLDSTKERDHDQVLSRAACQKHLTPEFKVLAMVDQLWLWVLAGRSGQPTTIVTCFPHRELQSNNESNGGINTATDKFIDPDALGDTNILKQVLSHMLDNPQAYLEIGGQDERLRFKEMYEMAIGDVMQQETELFDEFNGVMEATKKERNTKQSLRTQLKSLSKVENSDKNQSQTNKQLQAGSAEEFEALFEELKDDSLNQFVRSLVNSSGGKITKEKVQEVLKMAQFRVLDITKEVQLLHEIKDVQDELRIVSMIFRDQKVIVDEMEEIMRSIPLKGTKSNPSVSQSRKPEEQIESEHSEEGETTNLAREEAPINTLDEDTEETGRLSSQERNNIHVGNNAFFNIAKGANPPMPGPTDYFIGNNAFFESRAPEPGTTLDEKERYVLSPRAIVQLSMSEIEHMIDGANNAFNALNLLIDLKQKQSNVMDARYARMQAEESVKQGKTIMVFTIVTIIFLPLSFMAAFFAIDISQFKRVKDGKLSLGYVSEIMCKYNRTADEQTLKVKNH